MKIAAYARRTGSWVRNTWPKVYPGRRARRGAGAGGAALLLALFGYIGLRLRSGLGAPVDLMVGLVVAALGLGITAGALWLLGHLIRTLPRFIGWPGAAALAGFVLLLANSGMPRTVLLWAAGTVLVACVLGGTLAAATAAEFLTVRLARKVLVLGALATALVAGIGIARWLASRGTDDHLVSASPSSERVEPLAETNPSARGPYQVATLTYGSGTDSRRPEFGAGARLRTAPVDARPFVKGYGGWRERVRSWYWGFGPEAFPLNGRVWYPEGAGPFPLVLIVHGNHEMTEYSDPGYGWLGELLASRGMIFVSVDQNFLNTLKGRIVGAVPIENDARGWILLKHLEVWRGWNQVAGNPFRGKVDLERIALIGHSRGGEAVAIAGAFNRLPRYPDDVNVPFAFNFNLRALIAIAPSDGQYNPADRPTPLENLSYFTLQGGHASDVSSFTGDRQYNRVRFRGDGDWFKASLYIYRANHGQFNTVWGDKDVPEPFARLLNLRPLLEAEAQRRAGAIYMSGFLEATLRGRAGYRRMFRDPRSVAGWLPSTVYVTRYEDATFRVLADYEEDVDPLTTTAPGAGIAGERLVTWREQDIRFRKEKRRETGVYLGWRRKNPGEIASYSLEVPASVLPQPGDLVVLNVAEADEKPPQEDVSKEKTGKKEVRKEPIEFTLELEDAAGAVAAMPVRVPPKLPARFTKLKALDKDRYGSAAEPVLQTLEFSLEAFRTNSPFEPAKLRRIRLKFDRTAEGVLILDRVGFTRPLSVP